MYFSKWVFKKESDYYETILSMRKGYAKIFKIRIIPLKTLNSFEAIICDYKTGFCITIDMFLMKRDKTDAYLNLHEIKNKMQKEAIKTIENQIKFYKKETGYEF